MRATTGYQTFLYCFEDGDVRIVCPLSERGAAGAIDIVTPYGFSGFVGTGTSAHFPAAWKDFVAERGYVCGYIGLNPLFDHGSYYAPEDLHQHNEIYVLDLTLSQDELFRNLSQNRQRQLRHWERIAPTLILDRDALFAFFLDNFDAFFHRKHASAVYQLSRETLAALLDAQDIVLVGAGQAGRVEAVTLFAYSPHTADFLFNVSLPGGQQHSATLLWYGVTQLKALAIPSLNLGGGARPNDGIAQFKQRFGGRGLPLTALKQVYRPDAYAELCRQAGADPADRSGYFPAYRRPTTLVEPAHHDEEER